MVGVGATVSLKFPFDHGMSLLDELHCCRPTIRNHYDDYDYCFQLDHNERERFMNWKAEIKSETVHA